MSAMKRMSKKGNRSLHRWIALMIFVPFSVILGSGILLQFKRWIP